MTHRYNRESGPEDVWVYDGELDLERTVSELDYVSKSRLKTILTCARQFAYIYWCDEREPDNYYTIRGTEVHDALEIFHRNLKEYVDEHGERPERFAPLMGDSSNWEQWLDWIADFFKWEEQRWEASDSLSEWLPHSMEVQLEIDDAPHGELPWMGAYDALVNASSIPEGPDEGYAVVDYKTGSLKEKEQYRKTGIYIDLEFYAWMLEESGYDVTLGVGVYPKEGDYIAREMPNSGMRNTIKMAVEAMHQPPTKENYPVEESPLCDWCHFQDQCPSTWGQ